MHIPKDALICKAWQHAWIMQILWHSMQSCRIALGCAMCWMLHVVNGAPLCRVSVLLSAWTCCKLTWSHHNTWQQWWAAAAPLGRQPQGSRTFSTLCWIISCRLSSRIWLPACGRSVEQGTRLHQAYDSECWLHCIIQSATFSGFTKKCCWRCVHSRIYSCTTSLKKLKLVNETFQKDIVWLWHVDALGCHGLHH